MSPVQMLALVSTAVIGIAAGSFAYARVRPVRVTATTDLAASPAEVWAVLADTAAYHEWNPSIVESRGTVAAGERLDNTVVFGTGTVRFTPLVLVADPGRELTCRGSMGVRGLADGTHSFVLDPLPDGGTRLTQPESFTGILVPWATGMLRAMEPEFAAVNTAMGRRAGELRRSGTSSEP